MLGGERDIERRVDAVAVLRKAQGGQSFFARLGFKFDDGWSCCGLLAWRDG